MGWLQTDHRFPDRGAILTMGHRDFPLHLYELLERYNYEIRPFPLEQEVRALIMVFRPELAGCVIHWMNFDAATRQWEIGVSHATLPIGDPRAHAEKMPLRKAALDPVKFTLRNATRSEVRFPTYSYETLRERVQDGVAAAADEIVGLSAAEAAKIAVQSPDPPDDREADFFRRAILDS